MSPIIGISAGLVFGCVLILIILPITNSRWWHRRQHGQGATSHRVRCDQCLKNWMRGENWR